MLSNVKLKITPKGHAFIIFNNVDEKINTLRTDTFHQIEKYLNNIKTNSKIKSLTFKSSKPKMYIAGVDVNLISDIKTQQEGKEKTERVNEIILLLESLKIPTLTVINGPCVGGGLEIALATKYRIASDIPETKIGLPEVNIGIVPGFGGSQRLPKLIGFTNAMKMIVSGSYISTSKALAYGLIDKKYSGEINEKDITSFMEFVGNKKTRNSILKSRKKAVSQNFILDSNIIGRTIVSRITKNNVLKITHGNYPAPLRAIELISKTYRTSLKKGLQIEAEYFPRLAVTDVSKNLIQLFLLNNKIRNEKWIKTNIKTKEIKNSAVIGTGTMGSGISWILSYNNIAVRICDLSYEAIANSLNKISKLFLNYVRRKRISFHEAKLKQNLISFTDKSNGLKNKDIIFESISENFDSKKRLLNTLESNTAIDTILTTGTSSLSISKLADGLKHPERFIGFHFFNPVNRMPLVEIIPGKKTSAKTVAYAIKLAKKMKKTPILVKDSPGFLINRILTQYLNEAILMLEEGISFKNIDIAFEKFGMPMGPFKLIDKIGFETSYEILKILSSSLKFKTISQQTVKSLKEFCSESGFYSYKNNKSKFNKKLHHQFHKANKIDINEITQRGLLVMINEASKCLEERVISNAEYLDMALILGTGFPFFRGGLLAYADNTGIDTIYSQLLHMEKTYGKRYKPSKIIINKAAENSSFIKV